MKKTSGKLNDKWVLYGNSGKVRVVADVKDFPSFYEFLKAHKDGLIMTNLDGSNLKDCDFSGWNLTGVSLRGAHLDGSSFENARMRSVNISRSTFDHCHFKGVDLSGSNAKKSFFKYADFDKSILDDVDFTGSNFFAASLDSTTGKNTCFKDCDMNFVSMAGVIYQAPDFESVDFENNKSLEPGRRLPNNCTSGSVVFGGDYSNTNIPDSFVALKRDEAVSNQIKSLPGRLFALAIPGPPGTNWIMTKLIGFATDFIIKHAVNRLLPSSLKKKMAKRIEQTGVTKFGHSVYDSKDRLPSQIASLVGFTSVKHLELMLAAGEIEDKKYAPKGFSARLKSTSRDSGRMIVCDGSISNEAVNVVAMYHRKVPRARPITLVDGTNKPHDQIPDAIRFDKEGMCAAWFKDGKHDYSIRYNLNGDPTAKIVPGVGTLRSEQALMDIRKSDHILDDFLVKACALDSCSQVDVVAARYWRHDTTGAWTSIKEENLKNKLPDDLHVGLRVYLDAAAEEFRQLRKRNDMKKNRALVSFIMSTNIKTISADKLSKVLNNIADNLEVASEIGTGYYTPSLARISGYIRNHANNKDLMLSMSSHKLNNKDLMRA